MSGLAIKWAYIQWATNFAEGSSEYCERRLECDQLIKKLLAIAKLGKS
jgi:hypothetical protein